MTSMPASRGARAMIFAPRSCPSRPGLATTTRIFRAGVLITGRGMVFGPAPPRWCGFLPDLERHRHARVDRADDVVRALRVRGRLEGALRLGLRVELLRAARDRDVVRRAAGPPPLDRRAALDADGLRAEEVVADLDALRGAEGGDGERAGEGGHEGEDDESLHAFGTSGSWGVGLIDALGRVVLPGCSSEDRGLGIGAEHVLQSLHDLAFGCMRTGALQEL